MKALIKFSLIAMGIILVSCEDPISVDLNDAPPRLVVEASLDWEKGTSGNNQTIKLTTSTPYFDTEIINDVLGASVRVTNTNTQQVFIFQDQNNGLYTTSSFVPRRNDPYRLEIQYNGETYTATETLTPVTEILEVSQSLEGGFDDELLDVSIFFQDPDEEGNYYLMRFIEEGDQFPVLETESDEFSNGNLIDEFFEKDGDAGTQEEEFQVGDTVTISLYGISEQYFNYIDLLIEQYDSGGDPFATTPARIRGNCINTSNPDNYAHGYFRVTEVDVVSYTFE
ncbi:DUF4249 domain-containing protein [Aureisphaera galaxeae]|uniref:DUF4249 domain-containing protein n=1 Tax=Aureisphaera galaxeae TaxID=1538023 RepID=UPI00234FDB47|nr:DUF4249 domain-containing protein [Aureisphaera galaxeae]MDC8002679.1 DUF4249 domain-containing protein [Aureisphaera galaxeae]